jgi:hypothetical protein
MNDMRYVIGTIAFFALMLAFVRGAAGLGSDTGSSESNDDVHR